MLYMLIFALITSSTRFLWSRVNRVPSNQVQNRAGETGKLFSLLQSGTKKKTKTIIAVWKRKVIFFAMLCFLDAVSFLFCPSAVVQDVWDERDDKGKRKDFSRLCAEVYLLRSGLIRTLALTCSSERRRDATLSVMVAWFRLFVCLFLA